jgi:CRP-like cAMP-binding protein/rhodanese-related sulfurtransferase
MTTRLDLDTAQTLSPLGRLKDDALRALCEQIEVRLQPAGYTLFKKGDSDPATYFLLSGSLQLDTDAGSSTLQAPSASTRYPVANARPRRHTAVAGSEIQIAVVNSDLLDKYLALAGAQTAVNTEVAGYEVAEFELAGTLDLDWATALLQSPLFADLSLVNVVRLALSFEQQEMKKGEVVIRQGDQSLDYYYVIRHGHCEVVQADDDYSGREIVLAKLSPGQAFGEDALMMNSARTATVVASSDGQLMRLSRESFDALLVEPRVQWMDFNEASRAIEKGAQPLDVRFESEFEIATLPGAINIPFYLLRLKLPRLDRDSRYIVFCNDASQSVVAAFLLRQAGFDASVIRGGLAGRAN